MGMDDDVLFSNLAKDAETNYASKHSTPGSNIEWDEEAGTFKSTGRGTSTTKKALVIDSISWDDSDDENGASVVRGAKGGRIQYKDDHISNQELMALKGHDHNYVSENKGLLMSDIRRNEHVPLKKPSPPIKRKRHLLNQREKGLKGNVIESRSGTATTNGSIESNDMIHPHMNQTNVWNWDDEDEDVDAVIGDATVDNSDIGMDGNNGLGESVGAVKGESGESGNLVDSQNKLLNQDEVYQNSLRSGMDIVLSGSSLAVYPVPIINDGGLENGDDAATDFFGNLIVVPKKVVLKKDDGKNGNGDGSRSSGRGSLSGNEKKRQRRGKGGKGGKGKGKSGRRQPKRPTEAKKISGKQSPIQMR